MIKAFNIGDLELLCDDLEQDLKNAGITGVPVNLELVGGSNKTTIILNLIGYFERRGLLPYLVAAVRRARPGII